MKPLRIFLSRWFAEVEPDEKKRDTALLSCLTDLQALSRKHSALILNLACIKYLSLDGGE